VSITRRQLLASTLAATAASLAGGPAAGSDRPYRRIATEEAWLSRDVLDGYKRVLDAGPGDEPGFYAMGRFIFTRGNDSALMRRLLDIGDSRLADMDELGIDQQVLSLTAPGVQVFGAADAIALSVSSNDELAEAVRKHPARFAGLAAVPPQAPDAAAKEMERAVNELGLNGVVINSHTKGEYLDDPKFWPIFEAAEALDAPVYIHPRTRNAEA
jgi:5-carboxyvanillate decarboxylase